MRLTKSFLSASLLYIAGAFPSSHCFAQTDTVDVQVVDSVEVVLDTTDYILGNNHFNLVLAADKGYEKEVLRLLNKGAFIDSRTADGVTPLMYAVENQHAKVVKILLLNGANPNLKDFYGTPAMIPAVKKGNPEICELLISKGADVDMRDGYGRTPLMYAVSFNDYLLTDMLVFYQADVNLTDNEDNTALNIAAFLGYGEIVKLLSEKKAILEKPDKKDFTPLHSSSQNGHEKIVDYLLSQGASTALKTKAGYTPLALAIQNNHYAVTALLIEKGANVNEKIAIATRPMNIANSNKNDSLLQLLAENGAEMFRRPAIQYYSINIDFSTSANDFFMGGGFGLHDTRYGFSASFGLATRITAKPVLVTAGRPNTYYQYWERRTYTYLGIYKRFKLLDLDKRTSGGLLAGGQLVYTFGNFRGADVNPDPRLIVSPVGGAYFQFRGMILTLGYEYLNFKIEKFSPNRFKLGMNFLIAGKGMKQPLTKTLWAE